MSVNKLALADAKRTAAVLEVLQMTIDGKCSILAACEEVGIPVSTYYSWVRKGEDTISAVRDLLAEQQREQLLLLTAAQAANIRAIADRVMDPDATVSLKDRKIADGVLRHYAEDLEKSLHAQPGYEEAASQFLMKGPTLKIKVSRLASMEITSSEDGLSIEDISDDNTIDAQAKDVD